MNLIYLFIPLLSGLIGWITNYLAVRMIFRPHMPIRFFGIAVQGLIPKRRKDLAEKISETVSEHLISHEDIINILKDVDLDTNFRTVIDDKLESFIKNKLFAFSPMIAGFLSDPLREKIKDLLVEELVDLLPDLSEKMASSLERSFDTKQIVFEKIDSFDLEKLESITLKIASRELKAIEFFGGILGFFIGIIQVFLIHFLS